jgi:transcriptional regulator with XRE-family HTH domain
VKTLEFTQWLQNQLDTRGWDHAELARRSGLTKGGISHIMNGSRNASPDVCIAVARALGISREEIFRARGYLHQETKTVFPPDVDPRLEAIGQAINHLPPLQREAMIEAWGATLRAAGIDYAPYLDKKTSTD